jgi:thiosulfate dehydrogenase
MENLLPWLVLLVPVLFACVFAVSTQITQVLRTFAGNPTTTDPFNRQLQGLKRGQLTLWTIAALGTAAAAGIIYSWKTTEAKLLAEQRSRLMPLYSKEKIWEAPDPRLAEMAPDSKLISYGRDLLAHTQDYFGEHGSVRPRSINGMNCQNCHLDAGSKPFGNNYFAVAGTYPQKRARSGGWETIPKRINDCFQRSLNGQPIDTTGLEMKAILAYMHWLATGVPPKEKPKGVGLTELKYLERAADPIQGKAIYAVKCVSCHGADGQGTSMPGEEGRRYPPLWGDKSYNAGAGLYRLSRFAGYIKSNMPFGASYTSPQLTEEEAWDLAAFINSQPRPLHPFLQTDWPDISKKPVDHPFGPFADAFPENQHKFGPFGPIAAFYKEKK